MHLRSRRAHQRLPGRGYPTFCEKPVALELNGTLQVVERVEAAGAILQIGFQRRFDAGYREAKRRIDAGEVGILYSLRLASHDPEPPHASYIPTSGGIYRDLHIHDFDILLWLTGGEADEVYARGAVRVSENSSLASEPELLDVDTSAALVTMSDGVLAVLTGGRHDPRGYDVRTEIFGSRDSISVGLDGRTALRSTEPGAAFPDGPGYPGFVERFARHAAPNSASFSTSLAGAENPCPPQARWAPPRRRRRHLPAGTPPRETQRDPTVTAPEVRIVAAWHEALNGEDVEGLVALSQPDIEMGGPRGAVRGVEVLREWQTRSGIRLEIQRIYHSADTIVVEQAAMWMAAETGETTGGETVASVFTIRDGRVAGVVRYPELRSALSAAGLDDSHETNLE
ncbi:MAG: nuclear transport factor 2 family protein [Chloroflexia bacterium]